MIYRFVRALWAAALFGFFRRVSVQGRENVPARGPVLFVANHANAFVDPLLILTRMRRPVTLTAKSTLRDNPLLRLLMRALNVLEFHRAQDVEQGADPARNADAMAACRRRLAEGGAVCIFPEGVSHSDPRLRPFKTGAARIALDYARSEEARRGGPLLLIPVGVHYEAKKRFRSAAGLLFGAPMDVDAWLAAHPAANARALTREIEARIRTLTTNFDTEDEVEAFARAAELVEVVDVPPARLGQEAPRDVARRVALVHRMQAGRERVGTARAGEVAALERRIAALYHELEKLGITAPELFLRMDAARAAFFVFREMELLLVGFPLAAWGWLNPLPAYLTTRALVRKMSKDRDHFASNAVFLSLPIFPVFALVQVTIVALLTRSAFWTVLYALSLPFAGAVGLLYGDRAGGAWNRARTFLLFLRRPQHQRRLTDEAREIVRGIRRLAEEAEAPAGA